MVSVFISEVIYDRPVMSSTEVFLKMKQKSANNSVVDHSS